MKKHSMRRRLLPVLLALTMALSLLPAGALAADLRAFTDVSRGAWYYEDLAYAVDHGLMEGTSATTFSPAAPMSRGQFVTVLGRMVGAVPASGWSGFADVDPGKYYAPYVAWAAETGIVSGTSAVTFSPDGTITREAMATIVARYLDREGIEPAVKPAVSGFADAWQVSGWARSGVEALRRCGLLTGDSAGNVTPQKPLSRAEGMTVLVRLSKELYEYEEEPQEIPVTAVVLDSAWNVTLAVGEQTVIRAHVEPADATDQTLDVALTNPIVSVSAGGVLTAWAPGSTTLYLTAASGAQTWVNITVTEPEPEPEEPEIEPEQPGPSTGETDPGPGEQEPVLERPTEQEAYNAMMAMKSQYPERTPWSNENSYAWRGGIFSTGYGCAGFAFLLSDAAFGSLPARRVNAPIRFSDVRVGDILRINSDTHSVIVLEVRDSSVVIAEGNFNYSVHWGRILTAAEVERADYLLTRW